MNQLDRAEFGKENWVWFWGWVRLGGRSVYECWPWRPQTKAGSMKVRWTGTSGKRHTSQPVRLAWLLAGNVLLDGVQVTVTCDEEFCCNPNHMKELSYTEQLLQEKADGVYDAEKYRSKTAQIAGASARRGTANRFSKLNDEAVLRIRREAVTPDAINRLAAEYGVWPQAIRAVAKRRTWTHVPEEDVS